MSVTCLVCGGPVGTLNPHWSLCFDCWRLLGEPRNLEEAGDWLDRHPELESAILKRSGRI